jgi:hypothetical protein
MAKKRPTHESDAMKIFLSDSVAPEILSLVKQYGDLTAAAIAYSAQRSPEFWNSLILYTRYCMAMRNLFEKLRAEGKPLRREWLVRIKCFAAKFDENVATEPSLYLFNAIAGVKVWSVYIPEYTSEIIVDILDERGRRAERLKLPVIS